MLEKIGHVKNPLTVIAIFAAIAEVSGAVVLSSLDTKIQEQYVMFLMFFPCLLVVLFFITLWWKHFVLYAPSDFKEDRNFMDAHFKRDSNNLPVSVGDLYSQEPAGTSLDDKVVVPEGDGARSEGDDVVGRSDRTPTSDPPLSEDAFAASEAPGSAANEGILSEPKTGMRSLKEFLRLHDIGRSRVVRKLAFNLGGNFQINVKPKQLPNILFDAVIESSIICVVGFVDISVGHSSDVRKIRQKFSDAERFWETLSDVDKDRFVFHLALMFGPEGKKINDVPVSDMVSQRSGLPFKTEVTLYEYDSKSLDAYPI